jgi:hypothetical protein
MATNHGSSGSRPETAAGHYIQRRGEETVQGLGVELCREPGQLLALGIGQEPDRHPPTLRLRQEAMLTRGSRWFLLR